jgi:hypothetical protein
MLLFIVFSLNKERKEQKERERKGKKKKKKKTETIKKPASPRTILNSKTLGDLCREISPNLFIFALNDHE